MQLQIQSNHFEANEQLLKTATHKFRKLEKFYDRIEKCNVILKAEKNNRKKKFLVEVRLAVPKEDLFASERAESFDWAIEKVLDDLKKSIIRHKEKMRKKRIKWRIIDKVASEEEFLLNK